MAYSQLCEDISDAVYANGNNEITGGGLEQVLIEMVDQLGAGAQYMGEATPSTSTAGLGDKCAFWIAKTQGTYTNMGGVTLDSGFGFIFYNGSQWSILQVPQVPAAGSITATELADGAVTTPKIAENAVTSAKILNGAVTTNKIASEAVTGNEIAEGAVDTYQLAEGAVTEDELGDSAVATAKIQDGAITAAKISPDVPLGSKMAIVTLASGTTSIIAQTDKYYVVVGTTNTLTITLPSMVGADEVKGCVVYLKTGTLAEGSGITITTANPNESVVYYDGFEWADTTTYELNCVWNGAAWVIAYGIVVA